VIIMLIGRYAAESPRTRAASPPGQFRAAAGDWMALLTGLSSAAAMTWAVIEAAWRETAIFNAPRVLAGVLVLASGWAVDYAAHRVIGANATPLVDKDAGQKLVTSGIYSVVRHPLYLSGILLLLGTNLYLGSHWAWAGGLLACEMVFLRMPFEEDRLVAVFGEAYRTYQAQTKAILPWLY